MSWRLILYIAANAVALAYCAYHVVCIVKESLELRAKSLEPGEKVKGIGEGEEKFHRSPSPQPFTSTLKAESSKLKADLLSLSRSLEACQ